MLGKILVPLDGSALADAVLPHIIALTRINGTVVTLLHVLETNHATLPHTDPVEWTLRKAEAQSYLKETNQQLQHLSIATEHRVLEGRAADHIVDYAQKHDFDLVALSSHGQGGLSGWNLSSVTQKVIHRLRKSVLIVPAHRSVGHRAPEGALDAARYRRILVPLDGSARADCVLPLATAVARQQGAELILAHVVTPPEMIQRMPLSEEDYSLRDQVVERNRTEANRYLDQLSSRLTPTPQLCLLESDNVAHALLQVAEEESIDLVVLAAHGHSGQNGSPYGRLSATLIDYCSVPLYIHQDLNVDEIEPLYAERMLRYWEPPHEQRINAYEYIVK